MVVLVAEDGMDAANPQVMMRRASTFIGLIAALGLGCASEGSGSGDSATTDGAGVDGAGLDGAGADVNTANPQPIPVPDADRIFLSGSTSSGGIVVAGAKAAVEPSIEVWVENTARDERHSAEVANDGSFVMQLQWADNEPLQCWARGQEKDSAKVALLLPPDIPIPPSSPLLVDDVSPVVDGEATVTGTVAGNSTLIVANQDTGVAVAEDFESQAGFSIAIAASAGDRLVVFAVAIGSRLRKGLVEVSVPGP